MIPHLRRDDPLETVRHLLTNVGIRRATTLGEAQAAAYIDSRLRRAGLRVSADTFRAATSLGLTYPLLASIGIVAALVGLWMPMLGLILALYGLMLCISDALATPLPTLARYRDSQNIVATRACEGAEDPTAPLPGRRVVLLAPLDAPLHATSWYALAGRQLAPLLGRIIAFALLLLLLALLTFDPRPLWRYGQVLPLLYLLLNVLPLPMQPGRYAMLGGAGALAVLLATIERLGTPRSVELWAVALGATATGNSGLYDLLKRYPFPPGETLFLVLQHIHSDQLAYARREGLVQQFAADPQLLQIADDLVASDPQIHATAQPYITASSIASVLHSHGYRALTLLTRPSAQQTTARDDILATVDEQMLEHPIHFVTGMVQQLDKDETHRLNTASLLPSADER